MSGGGGKVPRTMPEGRCYTDQDCLGDNKVCYRENENDVLGYCVTKTDKDKIERNKKTIGEKSEELARGNMAKNKINIDTKRRKDDLKKQEERLREQVENLKMTHEEDEQRDLQQRERMVKASTNKRMIEQAEEQQSKLNRKYNITPGNDIENACPICGHDIDDQSLAVGLENGLIVKPGCCSGVFHKNCALGWFNQQTNAKRFICPQCKQENNPRWVHMCGRLAYGDAITYGSQSETRRSIEQLERQPRRSGRYNQSSSGVSVRDPSPQPRDRVPEPVRAPDPVRRETLIGNAPAPAGGWYSESRPTGRTRPIGYSLDNLPSDDENGMNRLEEYVTSVARDIGWRGLPSVNNVERWRASHPFMPYTDNLNDREIVDVYGNETHPMSQVVMRGNMTGRMYTVYYTLYDDNSGMNNDPPPHVIFAVLAEYSPTSESSIAFMRGQTITPLYLGIVSLSTWNRERMNGDLDALIHDAQRGVQMTFTTYGSWVDGISNTTLALNPTEFDLSAHSARINRMRNDERIRRRRLYIIIGSPLEDNSVNLFDGETHENVAIYYGGPDDESLYEAVMNMHDSLYETQDSSIYLGDRAGGENTATPIPTTGDTENRGYDDVEHGDMRRMEDDDEVVHYQSVGNLPVGYNGRINLDIVDIEDGDTLLFREGFMDGNRSINDIINSVPSGYYGELGHMELQDWLGDHNGTTIDSIFTRQQILDDGELNSAINRLIREEPRLDLLVGGRDRTSAGRDGDGDDRYVFVDYNGYATPREFIYYGRYGTFEQFRDTVMRLLDEWAPIGGSATRDSSRSRSLGSNSDRSSSGMSDRSLGSTRASSNPSSSVGTPSIQQGQDFGYYTLDAARTGMTEGGYWPGTLTRVTTHPLYPLELGNEYEIYYTRLSMPPRSIGDRTLVGVVYGLENNDLDSDVSDAGVPDEIHMLPWNYDVNRMLQNEDGSTEIGDIRNLSIPTTNPHIRTTYGRWLEENLEELVGDTNNYRRLMKCRVVRNRRLYVMFPGMMGDYIFDGESHVFLGQYSENMDRQQRIESARSIMHEMINHQHSLGWISRQDAARVVAYRDNDNDNMSVVSDGSGGVGGRRRTLKKRKVVKKKSLKKRKIVKKKSLKKRKIRKKKSLKKKKVVKKKIVKKQIKRKTKRNIKKKRRMTKKR